jgi:hypothetical protein
MRQTLAFLVLLAAPAILAQNLPSVGYIFPAGGQQGSTFHARIGGQFLGGATNVYVSEPEPGLRSGIQAEILDYSRPLTQREFNELRKEFEELREKRQTAQKSGRAAKGKSRGAAWTAADERAFNQLRMKIAAFQRRPANPAIAETLTLKLTISPEATPGNREVRLRTAMGLSNPLVFKIGQLPEVSAKPAAPLEEPRQARFARPTPAPVSPAETRLAPPVVANGQIMPGEVDRYKFRARAGQKLVLAVSARELIPYLADAVPGWFQATLAVYDLKGRELAYADDFRFNPDPVLFFEPPKDGDYIVEIKDSIYRGREDFVYRLSIGELPFLTGIYPLGGKAGTDATVQASGWNLEQRSIPAHPEKMGTRWNSPLPGLQTLTASNGGLTSNPLPFARDPWPDTEEHEPNNTPAQAQPLELPIVVNGRINSSGDADIFTFSAKAGMELVAEVMGRRLGSPIDSVLRLTDASGSQLAHNDDYEDRGAGLTTHHADSRLSVKLPKDGTYFLHLSDAQRQGGPEFAYRLRLGGPQPDFELRVVPSSVTLRPGGSVPLTIYALRKDGFGGEIMLALEDDYGFVLGGGRVPPNVDKIQVTLTAPSTPMAEPTGLKIEARAVAGGKIITRAVVPAEDMMQAFFYRHLVPSKELLVCVNGNWAQRWPTRLVGDLPLKIPSGGVASVRITVPRTAISRTKLELSDPPEGISIKTVGSWASGAEIVFSCEADKLQPGSRGNLIVQPSNARPQGNRVAGAGQFNPLGSLPAIPYEIVSKQSPPR